MRFCGSLSYSYYFSVTVATAVVAETATSMSYPNRKVHLLFWKGGIHMPENRGCGCGCGFGGDNCIWIIIVILIILCCCGGNGFGNCGCGGCC